MRSRLERREPSTPPSLADVERRLRTAELHRLAALDAIKQRARELAVGHASQVGLITRSQSYARSACRRLFHDELILRCRPFVEHVRGCSLTVLQVPCSTTESATKHTMSISSVPSTPRTPGRALSLSASSPRAPVDESLSRASARRARLMQRIAERAAEHAASVAKGRAAAHEADARARDELRTKLQSGLEGAAERREAAMRDRQQKAAREWERVQQVSDKSSAVRPRGCLRECTTAKAESEAVHMSESMHLWCLSCDCGAWRS